VDDGPNRKFQKELNAGAIALMLLGTLHRAGRAMYGYEIAKHLSVVADGALPMNQGALYPALRSLEKSGLLASDVEPSVSGPPRRYYRITVEGVAALGDWIAAWERTKTFVDAVLEQEHASPRDPQQPGHSTLPGAVRAGVEAGAGGGA
jgi:PadR family transcriptional regulator PadR